MGRRLAYHPIKLPSHMLTTTPLATGGNMSFYEPDQLLSTQMTPRAALPMELAVRETAWNYYRVLGFLPNPSETLRRLGRDISEYKYLLEDSHVNGCMTSRKAGTLCRKWELDRGDSPAQVYQTIKALFDAWPIYDIMQEALNCLFFGYQPVEVIWEKIGGAVLPKEVVCKDPDWFRFSDINEIRYLTKRNMVTGEPVPQYKFLMPRYRASYERPYGRPLGSVIYWPTKMVHTGFRFLTNFCEKYGQPWVRASYPLGTQEQRVQELINAIDSTIQDGIVAFPDEWKVEALEMNKTSSAEIFKTFIEMAHQEIAVGILGQNLTTVVSGGSYAASKTHGEIRQDIVDEDIRIMERMFNDLISWIYELNYSATDAKPTFKLVQEKEADRDSAQAALTLTQTGIKFTKEYYQNRFGMLDTEFDLTALPAQQVGSDGNDLPMPSEGDADVTNATHDATDMARNQESYDSTKDAAQNLNRR